MKEKKHTKRLKALDWYENGKWIRITSFRMEFYFLSNFYLIPVTYKKVEYPSLENAYQAAKSKSKKVRSKFVDIKPGEAKKLGGSIKLRDDWEEVKDSIMLKLLRKKFKNDPLKRMLLQTKRLELIEGNWWNDEYWGISMKTGKGGNKLGKFLMKVRKELKDGTKRHKL